MLKKFLGALLLLTKIFTIIWALGYAVALVLALMNTRHLPEPEDAMAWTWMFPADLWGTANAFLDLVGPAYDQIAPYHNCVLSAALAGINAACNAFVWWVDHGSAAVDCAQLAGLVLIFVLCGGVTGLAAMIGATVVTHAIKAVSGGHH